MKKTLILTKIIVLILGFNLYGQKESDNSALCIDSLYDVEINGTKQKILVQSNNINNPVLLWLHGGPGTSEMFINHYCMTKVLDFFTVVHWDQRGTALSYNNTVKSSDISFEKIFDDAVCLTEILKKTYQKDKIFLIGHSFGSVLGIHLAEKFPELYYAYIGIGQVVDDNRSREITYKWLVARLKEDNDTASIAKIKEKHLVPRELINRYRGIYYNGKTLFDVIKTSPYYFDGYLDDYNKSMKFVREANGKPEGKYTFITIDSITKINIPTYFFEGKHDRIAACAPELVIDFCKKLEVPKKEIIWFENSAHHPNIDEPEKFQNELINIAKKHITPEQPHISFSFDDGSTNDISTYDNKDWNSMIRKQLRDNQVQAIWFVAGKAVDNDKGKHLLQRWNDDGHLIGNHTFNHLNYNDSLMTCKSYFENIQKCDSLIRGYKNYRKIFRCPYLNAGVNISKRDSLIDFLQKNDYKAGWVTIDNAEWYINMRLIQLLNQNPKADISGYRDYYINSMFDMANYYNKLSIQNNHRQIKHTILLHFNLTSALFLNDLIKKFRNEGWIIDNYSEAIKDSVYSEHPIAMPSEHSLIWMQEMQRVGSVPRYDGEDSNYLKEDMDKLGL